MLTSNIDNKRKILNFFLKNIKIYNWSEEAMEEAFKEYNPNKEVALLIFEDLNDITHFFVTELLDNFSDYIKNNNQISSEIESAKVKNKIKIILFHFFKYQNKDYVDELFIFLQKNKIFYNKISYLIASEIWYISKDKSTDFNFYSKRIILSFIYKKIFAFERKILDIDNYDTILEEQIDSHIEKLIKFFSKKYIFKQKIEEVKNMKKKELCKYVIKKIPFIRLKFKD